MTHIVFVDDNPDFLDLVSQELENPDYKISTLLDQQNQDLLPEILSLNPDILFVDIYLVSTSVKDLCSALKANPETSSIPLYLISFSEPAEIDLIAKEAGVEGALPKPITRDLIKNTLQKHFH